MNEAVFISDLHLNPDSPELTSHFIQFCQWAVKHTKTVYILGDFFHLWIGDDDNSTWIEPICDALKDLEEKGVKLFYMGGNRDFLLGNRFCQRSQMQYLPDATMLQLDDKTVALTHGDRLCTKDKAHQLFYRLTRNTLFRFIFNGLPFNLRLFFAQGVRNRSQRNKPKQPSVGYVTLAGLKRFTRKYPCDMVIHGHTHQPALHQHVLEDRVIARYVLSDWDDKIVLLCYHKSKGFYFYRFEVDYAQKQISHK